MSRYFDGKVAKYSEQMNLLNEFAIRLKKEIIAEKITSITCEEVDAATLPALFALQNELVDLRKR